jgi:hypothetical protein
VSKNEKGKQSVVFVAGFGCFVNVWFHQSCENLVTADDTFAVRTRVALCGASRDSLDPAGQCNITLWSQISFGVLRLPILIASMHSSLVTFFVLHIDHGIIGPEP